MTGERFWKVEDSHAMLPPNNVKQFGRPKSKRNREPNEARKRKGEWSQSKKGTQMTYSNYDEPNHNAKGCEKDYIESKMLAEKEMLNFGKEGLEVLTLCCGLVGGHTYLHYTPTTLAMFLSILTRGEFLLYTQVEDDRDEDVEMDM
ncbi:putative TGACG-sequence-specific DNA-binding protein TGA-2.1-like [Capsicum annuum]|uniref:Uncharacterized protein n=1 Tax=Capsicum annuum TaxID=4072 RepID=A0A2G2YLU7_CAPAN|nr:putative TGACG-sequence-specific DNA-binding protein TGA-2.1-like [Capsicum annuum]PHT70675.1 hypothetical protein T459_25779 [Capsicum annuum]